MAQFQESDINRGMLPTFSSIGELQGHGKGIQPLASHFRLTLQRHLSRLVQKVT